MIVSRRFARLSDAVDTIINALANRLTAADNWGPEGTKDFVLTSNGPSPDNPPPEFKDIRSLITATGFKGEKGDKGDTGDAGLTGPPGPQGDPGEDGASGMVPTYIGLAETFTVPVNKQALYALPIVNDGSLVVSGDLVMVD